MHITRTIDAAIEPVTSSEFEEQVVISSGFEATKVSRNLKAARQMIEKYIDTSFITQTYTLTLTNWPKCGRILLPKGPIQSVTSFSYIDSDGTSQNLVLNTDYKLDTNGQWGVITPLYEWPDLQNVELIKEYENDKITIVYVTGYGDAASDVPDWAKESIIAQATILYERGAPEIDGMEKVVKSLIDQERIIFNYAVND